MCGLAALCRPTFLAWLGLIAIFMLIPTVRQRRYLSWLLLCLGALFVMSPWVVRNSRQFGHPILATTHGGYTLWLGNNEGFYQFLKESDWGEVWDSKELDDRYNAKKAALQCDEIKADDWARQQAMHCIQRQPSMFVYSCLIRIGRLWGPLPHRLSLEESTARRFARYAVAVWYICVFLLAAYALVLQRKQLLQSPWVWGVTLCLAFTIVHCLYWSNLRMRGPLMPAVYLAAAWGFAELWQRGYRALARSRASAPSGILLND
jgi:hypothetical protein